MLLLLLLLLLPYSAHAITTAYNMNMLQIRLYSYPPEKKNEEKNDGLLGTQ